MQDYGNVESILAEINAPAPEAAAPVAEPAQTAPAPQEPVAQEQPKEFQFNWNGQAIKAKEEDLVKWASQGYDYSQKMQQFQQQQQEFQQKLAPYKQIDEFASKNPDWWNHVENQWKERDRFSVQQSLQALSPEQREVMEPLFTRVTEQLQKTEAELAQMREFQTSYNIAQEEQRAKAAMSELEHEIQSVAKEFNVNLQERDKTGQTLEWRVGQFAKEKGLDSFKDAYYLYNRDAIRKADEMRARESLIKEMQADRRAGLLPQGAAPGQENAPVPRMRSWDDAMKFAMKDLGL
jgi:hypothetical protein